MRWSRGAVVAVGEDLVVLGGSRSRALLDPNSCASAEITCASRCGDLATTAGQFRSHVMVAKKVERRIVRMCSGASIDCIGLPPQSCSA